MPAQAAAALLGLIAQREPRIAPLLRPYADALAHGNALAGASPSIAALEGTVEERLAPTRSRSRALRDRKLKEAMDRNGHIRCQVLGCGFDFLETYGEIGRGYMHVHHRQELSRRKRARKTKPSQLDVVCPNCHAMIHRQGQCRPLKGLIKKRG